LAALFGGLMELFSRSFAILHLINHPSLDNQPLKNLPIARIMYKSVQPGNMDEMFDGMSLLWLENLRFYGVL
jgi:hypothetical protein